MQLHSLTREKILGLVGKTIFDRGVQYAQNGRVVDLLVDPSEGISALVESNDTCEVAISEGNQQLEFHCDCPYEGICKHLVAVLLCYLELPKRSRSSSRKGAQTPKSLRDLLTPLPQLSVVGPRARHLSGQQGFCKPAAVAITARRSRDHADSLESGPPGASVF